MFNWQLQRARQLVTEAEPDLPRVVRTASWDWLEDAIALYERFGLEPVRYNDVLSRPLAEPIPVPPSMGPSWCHGAKSIPSRCGKPTTRLSPTTGDRPRYRESRGIT